MTEQKILKKIISTPSSRGDALVSALRRVTATTLAFQAAQNRRIAEQEKTIREQTQRIAEQEKTIREQEEHISNYEQTIDHHTSWLEKATNEVLQKHSHEIKTLQAKIRTYERDIATLKSELAETNAQLKQLKELKTDQKTQSPSGTQYRTLRATLAAHKNSHLRLLTDLQKITLDYTSIAASNPSHLPLILKELETLHTKYVQLLERFSTG